MLMGLAFVGACIVMLSAMDHKAAGEDRRGTQAQFVAEAGVEEVLGRLSRVSGTDVTINGNTFDPAIRDPATPPDVNWETRIYLPGAATPVSLGSTFYTPTVQVASTALDYVRNGDYVSVRHRWRDRDGDNARDADEIVRYDSGKFPPENFETVRRSRSSRWRDTGRGAPATPGEATRFPFLPERSSRLSPAIVVSTFECTSPSAARPPCGHPGEHRLSDPCSPTGRKPPSRPANHDHG